MSHNPQTTEQRNMQLAWQTPNNTWWGYLYCHGCGARMSEGLLIDCRDRNPPAETQQKERFWLRLCPTCAQQVVQMVKDNT